MARRRADNGPLAFSCDCKAVRGHLQAGAAARGVHAVCYCRDCRAAELWLGRPDPAPGPVDVFQTTPDMIRFQSGTDRLGLLRLSPKGLMRWYATCCNAPLFNTLASPRLPFAALHVARLDSPESVGPVRVHSFVPRPGGRSAHRGWGRMILRLVTGMGGARLSGRWRRTPFFDPDSGAPVAEATIPDKAARAALYSRAPGS
ncbi:MAG: hypothetical protein KDK02_10415 [Rhodobacteraceae bacterium]|nr:hypothetical protein [Paracoccaceae bacterium]